MKLRDIVNQTVIDPRKLTHYALDPNSPYGKHKAVLFEAILGFTKENHTLLIAQLEAKSLDAEAVYHSEDNFGKRYSVDVTVEGIQGQQAVVRTGWLVPPKRDIAYLTTLYVKRK
ncbi:MAG: hypothetical protein KDJ52_27110 [Anaerolineae bacterium]|nr:hypothetical protein [Anaerolineae bacterium]